MAYTYKIKKRCFIGGVLRDPGSRHDPYVTDKKLDPCPSALELIKSERAARKVSKKPKDAAPQPDNIQAPGEKVATQDVKFEM